MFHRESGLFDHGDRRCLGVSAGQSPGEQCAPVFRGCGFGLLCAIQRQTRRNKRFDLGAIDDEPGFVAGTACGYICGMAIEPGIEQDDRPIDGHALRAVHCACIGPAEPGSSAFVGDVGGNKADAALVDDRFNADVAGRTLFFRRISMDGSHGRNRAVDNAKLIVAKPEADLVAGRDFKTG
ncbi:conserved hypothetical protein [Ricinus communis]|uniref:Uncharacterized protein n=1 Tax=Ricinus communis TaxID=3988 RepID=B9TI77_RICCO|nr:conserved hypothetical protein [Ricinus communis]